MSNEHLNHEHVAVASILAACKTILTDCGDFDSKVVLSARQLETLGCTALTLGTIVLGLKRPPDNSFEDRARTELALAAIARLARLCDRLTESETLDL